jgi:hypothetical protein
MSDDGTAEIGEGDWPPVGGLGAHHVFTKVESCEDGINARAEGQPVVAAQRRVARPQRRARALVKLVHIRVRATALCVSIGTHSEREGR